MSDEEKGSNVKKWATPLKSKFETQFEHTDRAWNTGHLGAVELCFKYKWKVRIVTVPLTKDKGDY